MVSVLQVPIIAIQPFSNSHLINGLRLCNEDYSEDNAFVSPPETSRSHENNDSFSYTNRNWTVVDSLQYMLTIYNSMQQKSCNTADDSTSGNVDQPLGMLVSGGLQQYLIRQQLANSVGQQPRKGQGSEVTTFHDLPECIELHIFSFLEAKELCRVSSVCRYWNDLSCDDILWQRRLSRDINNWNIIGHATNPEMYRDCNSNLMQKEIYVRCSPEVGEIACRSNFSFHLLSGILRSFWPKKTPRIAMFGPGLESSTSFIVRKILEDTTGTFSTTGMFPGQFEGVGSGFTLKMSNGETLDLITLYSATQEQREGRTQEERAQNSHLMAVAADNSPAAAASDPVFMLQHAVQELCRTLDGFIFVVDATTPVDAVSRAEMFAMTSDLLAVPGAPILILSCIPKPDSKRLSCIKVVQQLQLNRLNRPWQVHNCIVDTMEGILGAIHWAIKAGHRK